jgi:hypothetical protein
VGQNPSEETNHFGLNGLVTREKAYDSKARELILMIDYKV